MKLYDFKKGKENILKILSSKTKVETPTEIPLNDEQYPYETIGYKTWVSSLFVDIVDSTSLFSLKTVNQDGLARIMRAFVQEIVDIINSNDNCVEIGIRGDCVYGVFRASYKEDLVNLFRTSYCINAFLKMFNTVLMQNSYPLINAGIGIGCGEDLIIRAGKKRVASDKIYIGKALVNASNLSKIASRNGLEPICMDSLFYSNIIDILKKEDSNYDTWIKSKQVFGYKDTFYMCNIVQSDFNDWINGGMK